MRAQAVFQLVLLALAFLAYAYLTALVDASLRAAAAPLRSSVADLLANSGSSSSSSNSSSSSSSEGVGGGRDAASLLAALSSLDAHAGALRALLRRGE